MAKTTFTSTVEIKVDLPVDTIYDYIMDGETKIGIMLAYPDDKTKKIMLGYSRCHPGDQFNQVIGLQHALNCSKRIGENMGYDFVEVKEFPDQWRKFISRVKRYYQQLMFKEWCMPKGADNFKQIRKMVKVELKKARERVRPFPFHFEFNGTDAAELYKHFNHMTHAPSFKSDCDICKSLLRPGPNGEKS